MALALALALAMKLALAMAVAAAASQPRAVPPLVWTALAQAMAHCERPPHRLQRWLLLQQPVQPLLSTLRVCTGALTSMWRLLTLFALRPPWMVWWRRLSRLPWPLCWAGFVPRL